MLLSLNEIFLKQSGITEYVNTNSCVTIHCCLDQYPWPAPLHRKFDSKSRFYTLSLLAKWL